jgi:hypothetical protein
VVVVVVTLTPGKAPTASVTDLTTHNSTSLPGARFHDAQVGMIGDGHEVMKDVRRAMVFVNP